MNPEMIPPPPAPPTEFVAPPAPEPEPAPSPSVRQTLLAQLTAERDSTPILPPEQPAEPVDPRPSATGTADAVSVSYSEVQLAVQAEVLRIMAEREAAEQAEVTVDDTAASIVAVKVMYRGTEPDRTFEIDGDDERFLEPPAGDGWLDCGDIHVDLRAGSHIAAIEFIYGERS